MVDENPATTPQPNATTEATTPDASPSRAKIVLCPYCGNAQTAQDRCDSCGGLFEPMSRMATQIAMGSWFIRDKTNPFRPGCSYETLQRLIKSGKVTPTTVIRGPSTFQFWSVARNIPGVAHLVGYCHQCGAHVEANATACGSCQTRFDLKFKRDVLGLQYPNTATVEAAKKRMREISGDAEPEQQPQTTTDAPPAPPQQTSGDLLGQALGIPGADTQPSQANNPGGTTSPTAARPGQPTAAVATNPAEPANTPSPVGSPNQPPFPGNLGQYQEDPTQNPMLVPQSVGPEKSGGLSPMIWAMIILNIFVVITVGVLFFLLMQD